MMNGTKAIAKAIHAEAQYQASMPTEATREQALLSWMASFQAYKVHIDNRFQDLTLENMKRLAEKIGQLEERMNAIVRAKASSRKRRAR